MPPGGLHWSHGETTERLRNREAIRDLLFCYSPDFMLTAETKRRLDACRDILVGKLPLPTDQIELITLALIYKFMDDLDEWSVKLGGKRSFFTGPLEKYRWRALLPQTVSADERMNLFAEGIEWIGKAEHLPALFRDIFRNSFLKFRDGRILTLFLNEVNGFAYSHSEELGNAFEYLLKTMGIQAENGQFRTPRHIIDFMVACLDPQPEDRTLDPACGTGGFLVSCYKHILAKHTSPGSTTPGDKLTHEQRQKVYANLTGYDVTDLMVKLSKVNLFLHGFPDPAIHIYDTLTNDARWNEKADVILANPPFMTPKGGVSPHTKFRVGAKKSEVLFTDYIAEHLTPDGRGGVIVPNGIVATMQNAYVKLRKFLVEDSLVAVVSLPAGVFNPYSNVKTSILFLDKKLARHTKEILFLKITAEGFDLGAQRREIKANDLPEAERLMQSWSKGKLSENESSSLVWKAVEKRDLLSDKHVVLLAERWGNGEADFGESDSAALGEIVEKVSDTIDPSSMPSGTPCVGLEHVGQGTGTLDGNVPDEPLALKSAKVRFAEGDILFGKLRPNLNKVWLATFAGICSTDFFALRVNCERVEPRLLQLLMLSPQFNEQVLSFVRGAQLPRVSYDDLVSIEIPLPPPEEQRRVVAEIEGYQKVLNGARQILAGYTPSFDTDADWPVVKLCELCESITDGDHQPPPKSSQGVPFVTISNINEQHRLDFSNTFHVPQAYYEKLNPSRKPRRGDILYTVTGSYGIPVLVDFDEPFCFQRHIGLVRPLSTTDGKFLYWTLASSLVMEQAHRMAVGAAQKTVSLNSLRTFSIPQPPMDEQGRIVAELDAEAAQMEAVRALLPRFEAKIQGVLDRVWGNNGTE
jgi:type I restriction enzyme M protein